MRIFAIIGTIVTVLIIGFMAAMYISASTAPMTVVPSVETPYGSAGGETNQMNAVDTARSLVSLDKARQRDMQNQMDRMDHAWKGQ
ncbi:MAG: hypothetical protein LBS53_08145 [Synergistaceae bacterium]|nr:hypothetical protein [Synergistaceae bacterium]